MRHIESSSVNCATALRLCAILPIQGVAKRVGSMLRESLRQGILKTWGPLFPPKSTLVQLNFESKYIVDAALESYYSQGTTS